MMKIPPMSGSMLFSYFRGEDGKPGRIRVSALDEHGNVLSASRVHLMDEDNGEVTICQDFKMSPCPDTVALCVEFRSVADTDASGREGSMSVRLFAPHIDGDFWTTTVPHCKSYKVNIPTTALFYYLGWSKSDLFLDSPSLEGVLEDQSSGAKMVVVYRGEVALLRDTPKAEPLDPPCMLGPDGIVDLMPLPGRVPPIPPDVPVRPIQFSPPGWLASARKCTCGAEKSGGGRHSAWCDTQ